MTNRHVYRATIDKYSRAALIGVGNFYEGFTIDLPSYWRTKVVGMLKDPSTYVANAVLVVTGQAVAFASVAFEKMIKAGIKRVVRKILNKEAGVDYDTADKIAEHAAEIIFRYVFIGLGSVMKYIAKKMLYKINKRIAQKIADTIVPKADDRSSFIKRATRNFANKILTKIFTKIGKYVIKYFLRMPLSKSLRSIKVLAPQVIIDFVLQIAIECAIDTAEFMLWPTKAVGRSNGIGLMGGPNILDSLMHTYNFTFSRKYLAVHAQGFRPIVRNPRRTLIKPIGAKTRKARFAFTLRDLTKSPRWVYALKKPKVRHAARLGEIARWFWPELRTWSFAVSDLVVKMLPGQIAAVAYSGKGTLKLMTSFPLVGAVISEALARELNPREDLSTDALQGYYYAAGVAFGFPCLGAAGLVKIYRQDYHFKAAIGHSLRYAGNVDYTTFTWSSPKR